MPNSLTPAEARFVRALCGSGPLGIAPLGLARSLGLTSTTIVNLSVAAERKGFCTRERYGMRIFLRPTSTAVAFATSTPAENSPRDATSTTITPKKSRTPRAPRGD
jgi:DNA-binding MarR family transcriptional regulator